LGIISLDNGRSWVAADEIVVTDNVHQQKHPENHKDWLEKSLETCPATLSRLFIVMINEYCRKSRRIVASAKT
jgi:hypothetical protein